MPWCLWRCGAVLRFSRRRLHHADQTRQHLCPIVKHNFNQFEQNSGFIRQISSFLPSFLPSLNIFDKEAYQSVSRCLPYQSAYQSVSRCPPYQSVSEQVPSLSVSHNMSNMCMEEDTCSLNSPMKRISPVGKIQLLPPAPPYYPFPRGKIHTRGNIWSFTVG